jgi:hypothetical protein
MWYLCQEKLVKLPTYINFKFSDIFRRSAMELNKLPLSLLPIAGERIFMR